VLLLWVVREEASSHRFQGTGTMAPSGSEQATQNTMPFQSSSRYGKGFGMTQLRSVFAGSEVNNA
jgi:hypothetical protein